MIHRLRPVASQPYNYVSRLVTKLPVGGAFSFRILQKLACKLFSMFGDE